MTAPEKALVRLRLYVAGQAPYSAQAVANLAEICRRHLPDRHHVEVVDVLLEPGRALADGVFMTPTLVKLGPGTPCRVVGTLADPVPVLAALGLTA